MARQLQLQSAMNVSFNPAKQSTDAAKGQPHSADSFLALLNLADPEAALMGSAVSATAANSTATAKSLLPTGTQPVAGAAGKRRGHTKEDTNAVDDTTANTALLNAPATQSPAVRTSPTQGQLGQPNLVVPTDPNEQAQMLSYLATGTANSESPTAAMAQTSKDSWAGFGSSTGRTSRSSRGALPANWNSGAFAAQTPGLGISKQIAKDIRQTVSGATADAGRESTSIANADAGQRSAATANTPQALLGQVADNTKEQLKPDAASNATEQTPLPSDVTAGAEKMPWPGQKDVPQGDQSANGTNGNIQSGPAENLIAVMQSSPLSTQAAAVQTASQPLTVSATGPTVKPPSRRRVEQSNSGSRANETQAESSQTASGEKHTVSNGHPVANEEAAANTTQAASPAISSATQNAELHAAWNAANQNYAELFKSPKLSGNASISAVSPAKPSQKNAASEKNSGTQQKTAKDSDTAAADQNVSGDPTFVKQVAATAKTDDPTAQNLSSPNTQVTAASASANTAGENFRNYSPAQNTSVASHAMDETASAKPEINTTTPLGSVQTAKLVQNLSETEWRVGIQAGEFGKVDIHTSINQSQISARIYVEHDELGKVLAGGLPQLHEKLTVEHRIDAQVELYNSGSNYSGGASHQQHQQQQRPMEQGGYVLNEANTPAAVAETIPEPLGMVSATGVDMHV